jgi:hypothetical protein
LLIDRQTFRAVASQNAFPQAINATALVALAVYALGGAVGHCIGAGLALASAPLLWQTIRTSNSPLRPLLPKVESRNVVARIEPRGELRRHAVLLAHLDTNRCRLAWQSAAVRSLEPLIFLTLAVLAMLGLLLLAGALLGGPRWVLWAALVPAGYVAGTAVTLWLDERTPYSPGAHDNAAGAAVALEAARRLAQNPLEHTQIWLAFTGAEETDHAGLYALLGRGAVGQGPTVPAGAAFIGLEGLGSGDLVYLTRQGLCDHYTPDPLLRALAADAAAQRPELGAQAGEMLIEDEVGTLRRLGYPALGIAGRDPATGTLPRWHRRDDCPDTVSGEFMERAVGLVMALLDGIDQATG